LEYTVSKRLTFFLFPLLGLYLCGCSNSSVWEETKTAGRYINRKGLALLKQENDSRLVNSREEFSGPQEDEFIPLKDQDLKTQFVENSGYTAKEGYSQSSQAIPSLQHFKDPSHALANIFKNVYFNTDDDRLRIKEYYHTVSKIGEYLKGHPHISVFVAGHCDERASDAYNLVLGSKRANFIRGLLIKEGANPDQIFTISYGKQQPLVNGHNKAAWAKNRRAEFKIYDKSRVEE